MDRSDLYRAIENKMSRVVLQTRMRLERGLINELPYDEACLVHAGMGMIVASFRLACYHRDSIIIPKLGTFSPRENSVYFASEHKFDVWKKIFFQFGAPTEEERQQFNATMARAKLGHDDLLKIISEQLAPLYLSASPQEITETILSTWENTILNCLKMGWRVRLSCIGIFSFQENEIATVVFTPDNLLIRALKAGDYRRQNRHLYSED